MSVPLSPRSWRYLNILFVFLAVFFALSIGAGWLPPVGARDTTPDSSVGVSTATDRPKTPLISSNNATLEELRNRVDVLKRGY